MTYGHDFIANLFIGFQPIQMFHGSRLDRRRQDNHQEGPLGFGTEDFLTIAFQREELGLPKDEAGLHVFRLYFVPDDAENEVRQPGIRFGVNLEIPEPPGFTPIMTRNAFYDLEGCSSSKTD